MGKAWMWVFGAVAAVLVGCGNDSPVFGPGQGGAQTAAVGVGGTGGTGAGGDAEGGSGGLGGGATGQGGAGGSGGGEEGGGGQGGGGECPAPACLGQNEQGWNCDSACGAVDSKCPDPKFWCQDPLFDFGFGTWKLRMPAFTEQEPTCASECGTEGPWAAVRLYALIQNSPVCVSVTAPDGMRVNIVAATDEKAVDLCSLDGNGCAVATVPAGKIPVVVASLPAPSGGSWPTAGATISVTMLPGNCTLACNGGCNGGG